MSKALISIFLIALVGGCKFGTKDNSEVKEFENDADICKSIDDYTKTMIGTNPSNNGIEVFDTKKNSEKRILEDLITNYFNAATNLSKTASNTPADGSASPANPDSTATTSSTASTTPDPLGSTTVAGVDPNTNASTDGTQSSGFMLAGNEGESGACSVASNQQAFAGIPPHYRDVTSEAQGLQIVRKYCVQKTKLEATSCTYSGTKTKSCAALGASKPQWLTDTCEVIGAGGKAGLNALAGQSCGILAEAAASGAKGSTACGIEIIKTVCSAHYNAASDVAGYINKQAGSTDEEVEEGVVNRIAQSFAGGVTSCLTALAEEGLKKAILEGSGTAAQRWATYVVGKSAAEKILATAGKSPSITVGGVAKSVGVQVAGALCSAAANSVADSIDQAPTTHYKDACGPRTEKEQQAAVAACFRTTADACDAATGKIDFAAIAGANGGAGKITLDAISSASEAGCGLAGKVSSAACSAITQSVGQIIQAIKTGNNDWAECAGTTKMGACIGQTIGEWQTGRSAEALSTPLAKSVVIDGEKNDICCKCTRAYYADDYFSDTNFRRDVILNPTSYLKAGTDQSDCTAFQKLPKAWLSKKRQGWNTYYVVENCAQVLVKDFQCSYGYPKDAHIYPNRLPKKKVKGELLTGRTNYFGEALLYLGEMKCLDDDCS